MDNLEDLIKDIQIEDLPDSVQKIAQVIGAYNTVRLACVIGGTTLYFPKKDSLLMEARDRRIKSEYRNGTSYRDLALRYNLAETHVRRIIHEDDIRNNQPGLFQKAESL